MVGEIGTLPLVGSVIIAVVGLLAVLDGTRQYYGQWRAVRRAEAAGGTVESVDIRTVRGSNSTKSYLPVVAYEYQTPTQRLHGQRLYPGRRSNTLFGTESAAQAAIEHYEAGESTTVYYDPQNPDHAFLKPSVQGGSSLGTVGFGLLFLAIAAVLVVSTTGVSLP